MLSGGIFNHFDEPLYGDVFKDAPDDCTPVIIYTESGETGIDYSWVATLQQGPTKARSIGDFAAPENIRPYKGTFVNLLCMCFTNNPGIVSRFCKIYFSYGGFVHPFIIPTSFDLSEEFLVKPSLSTTPARVLPMHIERNLDNSFSIYTLDDALDGVPVKLYFVGYIKHDKTR